jgi:hypothetical protein
LKGVLAQQPVGAAYHSDLSCMNFYKSGIIMPDQCKCSDPDLQEVNHAITIVGYGKSNIIECDEYWLVKNSWGVHWGEHGLFKICADRIGKSADLGACQINSAIMWPSL